MKRGWIVGVVVAVAVAGCDRLFSITGRDAPVKDGPISDLDGSIGGDAAGDAARDAPPPPADGPLDAGPPSCQVCYGTTNQRGTAECEAGMIEYCGSGVAPYLETIDLCSCTIAEPYLYLFNLQLEPVNTADVVLLTTNPAADYALSFSNDGGTAGCQTPIPCDVAAECLFGQRAIRVWEDVPVATGANNFGTHSGICGVSPNTVFNLVLP